MRALIVTNMWPTPERPESGIFVADQAAALRRAGVDLEVFHFRGGSPASYVAATWRLARARRSLGHFDVVHAHFGLSAWVSLPADARVRAVTFHGTDLAHPRSRRISLAALRFVDLPAAVSDELASTIPVRAGGKRVETLPCGVALDRFVPAGRDEARMRLGLRPDERVILVPSDASRPEKRHDRARLLADAVGAKLISLGGIDPTLVPDHVNAADLVVIPSEREGFGLALLEAMACNRPVISTPNGIAREALSGVDGSLCADWDLDVWAGHARKVLDGPEPAADGRACERASAWSSDACAQRVIDVWSSALGRS